MASQACRHRWALVTLVFLLLIGWGLAGCSRGSSGSAATGDGAAAAEATATEGGDAPAMKPAERLPGTPAERIDPSEIEGEAESEPAEPEATPPDDGAAEGAQNVEGELVARFINVGQGDAALLTCDGQNLLIDGGPSSASSTLYTVLDRLGVDHLDYVIATHPDADHIGGLPGALSRASAGRVFCSVDTGDTARFEKFDRAVREGGGSIEVPAVGTTLPLGQASVSIIGPVVRSGDDNDDSLVVKVTYGSTAMLFMGDAEMNAEETLLDAGVDLRADVLKVGHHGSKTSSSAFFVQAVDPTYAVISVGENSYGHPDEDVLAMFDRLGIQTLRTDQMGDITLVSNGQDILLQDG